MKCLFFIYAILFFLTPQSFAEGFPTRSCKEQWRKAGLSKRDYLYPAENRLSYRQFKARIQRNGCYKEWLVLIYMNADNDLTEASYRDIAEMETVGSSVSVDLMVYHDSNENTGSRYLHIANTRPKIPMPRGNDFTDFTDDQILSPTAKQLEEQNSGDIAQFENFIGWGIQAYPAKHIAIIIWSHGMGWVARAGETSLAHPPSPQSAETPRKISLDFNAADQNAFFTIPNLHQSLQKITQTHLRPEQRIDIFGADACLFAQLSVTFELKEDARFLIGSASAEAHHGWPYHTIMRYLVRHPHASGAQERKGAGIDAAFLWAAAIPTLYQSSYSGQGGSSQGKDEEALMVSINLDELGNRFPESLNTFGDALIAYIQERPQHRSQLKATVRKTYRFSEISQDIYHFTLLINAHLAQQRREKFVQSQAAQRLDEATTMLQRALHDILVSSGVSPDYYDRLHTTKGISVWLPVSKEAYETRIRMFESSRLFHASPRWKAFIELLHSK